MSVEKHFCNKTNKCRVIFHLPKKANKNGKEVKVIGDFNDWEWEKGIPMEEVDGEYLAETELPIDATYQYRYLIDNREWENDWDADAYFPTEYGVDNSVVDTHIEETVQGLTHFVHS